MKNKATTNNSRKRTALLLLPLLLLPFLTLVFWALGGGTNSVIKKTTSGLNMELPNASLKNDATENKLGFYEQADQDSSKRTAQLKYDPLYKLAFKPDTTNEMENRTTPLYDPVPLTAPNNSDPNEEKVYRKLAQLNQQLQQTTLPTTKSGEESKPNNTKLKIAETSNRSLEQMQHMLSQNEEKGSNDPELEQLSGLLDKIKDIQQPPGIKQPLPTLNTGTSNIYSVSDRPLQASVSLLDTAAESIEARSGFYGLEAPHQVVPENAIQAVVPQSQTVTNGAVLKLQLLQPLTVSNVHIPQGTFLYGRTSFSRERLMVTITSIQYNKSLFPVQLDVYDLDGLPGVYVPGTNMGNFDWQTASNSLPLLQLNALDPSLKTQAVTTGLSAVKALLAKKQKQIKVDVKGGYQLLLKNKIS